MKRNENSLREPWDVKCSNICILGVPEGEEREKEMCPEKHLKRSNLKLKHMIWLWEKKWIIFELAKNLNVVALILNTLGNKPEGILSSENSDRHIQISNGWYIHTPSAKWPFSLNQYEGQFLCVSKTVGWAEIRTKLIKSKILLHSIASSFLLLF